MAALDAQVRIAAQRGALARRDERRAADRCSRRVDGTVMARDAVRFARQARDARPKRRAVEQ